MKRGSGHLLGFKEDPCCAEGSCCAEVQAVLLEPGCFLNCLVGLACWLSPVIGRTLKTEYLGYYFCSGSAQKTEQNSCTRSWRCTAKEKALTPENLLLRNEAGLLCLNGEISLLPSPLLHDPLPRWHPFF